MEKMHIVFDIDKCVGCYNCLIACQDEFVGNDWLPFTEAQEKHGEKWLKTTRHERGKAPITEVSFVTEMCRHCGNAACEKAFPEAVIRREDGIVLLNPQKAKGNKDLVKACPYGMIKWNEERQTAQKCTMCAHLLDEGYAQPRCVEACPNEALFFGDLDDPESEVSKVIAANKATPLKPLEGQETNVSYLNIPTVFLAGSVYLPGDETGEDPADGATVTLTCRETGEVVTVKTNYFGDWEAEWLTPNATYDIKIEMAGYQSVTLTAATDTDHYVQETILKA